jgi:hypothetical protein
MAQPVFYQTLSNIGFDPTMYYAVSASVTPETPAPPFIPGTRGFGSDGSEYIFVQASTSISFTDFVVINTGTLAANQWMANSVADTTGANITSSLACAFGSSGLVLKQSVSFIPAGAFFWVLTKGTYVPATTSGGSAIVQGTGTGLASNVGGVALFTCSVPGVLTSVTTSQSLHVAFQGIMCINSLTVSIAASIIPPSGGTQSNGFTVGPVVTMNNPRPVVTLSNSAALVAVPTVNIFSF